MFVLCSGRSAATHRAFAKAAAHGWSFFRPLQQAKKVTVLRNEDDEYRQAEKFMESPNHLVILSFEKRQISGMYFFGLQFRKDLFGRFAGNLEVNGIGAQVDLIASCYLTVFADVNFLKFAVIIPEFEHTLSYEMREVNFSLYPISVFIQRSCNPAML